jgi:hypothetical protein
VRGFLQLLTLGSEMNAAVAFQPCAAGRGGGPMTDAFFARPILNSLYAYPNRHWELDKDGQPTNRIIETRRHSDLITPVPKPRKRRTKRQAKSDQGSPPRPERTTR